MCGIAGMMSLDGVTPDDAALDAFVDALRHRGPDGEGRFAAGGVGLIQTRLAIIDLNTGDQPLYAEQSGGEQCVLVGNGEIYNYVELREELGTGLFKTQSDCEPPLQLYLKHGPDYPRYLRGMYALAVYDAARRQLIVSRDPLGIKPLYYTETSQRVLFCLRAAGPDQGGACAAECLRKIHS
jgi:asparagine synthase (glutamine-hydrolysing)